MLSLRVLGLANILSMIEERAIKAIRALQDASFLRTFYTMFILGTPVNRQDTSQSNGLTGLRGRLRLFAESKISLGLSSYKLLTTSNHA